MPVISTDALALDAPSREGRRHEILYRIRLSALYHQKRERFFDGLDKFISALVAISATAAVTLIFRENSGVEKVIAAATAALSLVPVIYNPAQKARLHNQLASEYRRILADCALLGETWSTKDCNSIDGKTQGVAANEPALLTAVVADCQNQLAMSFDEEPPAIMRWWHHCFKHFVDLRPNQRTSSQA